MLFPPLDKRDTRDKAKGLPDHFREAYRGELGVRHLSRTNREQDARQPVLLASLIRLTSTGCFLLPQRCLYLSALHGVISLPASGTSPVRHPSLPDLYEWSSSQLWCAEYPAIPLGKRSQVAYMYIGKGDEFARGVWWINNLLYLCTRN